MKQFSDLFENHRVPFDFEKGDRCALVGNSGILTDSGYGDLIDAHDCVVRMNAAPTEGYEIDVGSKESLRIMNGPLLRLETPKQTHTPDDWVLGVKNKDIIISRTPDWSIQKAFENAINGNRIYLPNRKLTHEISRWERRKGMSLGSTGFFAVQLFMKYFDNLDLFGFGFHEDDLSSRHYWESYKTEHEVNHRWKQEKKWIKRWDKEGHVKLYT
jgi:hypothetical protein